MVGIFWGRDATELAGVGQCGMPNSAISPTLNWGGADGNNAVTVLNGGNPFQEAQTFLISIPHLAFFFSDALQSPSRVRSLPACCRCALCTCILIIKNYIHNKKQPIRSRRNYPILQRTTVISAHSLFRLFALALPFFLEYKYSPFLSPPPQS